MPENTLRNLGESQGGSSLSNLGSDPFALAVRGDLQKQFPGDTPEQIEQRVAAVVAAMAPPAMRNAYRPEVQGGLRVNPENWAAFLAAQPRSTNIIDLRGQPPAQLRPGERLNTSTPLYRR